MKHYRPDPNNPVQLTPEEAERLDRMKDEDIDYSDIPKPDDAFFARATRPGRHPQSRDGEQKPADRVKRPA